LFLDSHTNVAVSGYLKHTFLTFGYPVVLIPNSVDLKMYQYRVRHKPGPKLLWVRAFSRIYNPLLAVDVIAELRKDYPEARLCMVGPDKDGSLGEFMKFARLKGVIDNIIITGKLDRSDWVSLSEGYDFFINTTNIDNTPVSVIEAMALGLIIVSTNPGGIPFLLSDNADSRLVNKGDANAMVSAIKYLIEHPSEAYRLTQGARLKAESFSSENTKSLWINLLS
jgi:glycosyltransferase involved in cell wall biosynthesis